MGVGDGGLRVRLQYKFFFSCSHRVHAGFFSSVHCQHMWLAVYIMSLLVVALIVYVSVHTPEWMSHLLWTMRIRRSYTVAGRRGYFTVSYNHSRADGMLTMHILKHCKLPKSSRKPVDACTMWTRFTTPGDVHWGPGTSSFQRLCAALVKLDLEKRPQDSTSVGIVVGLRNRLPPEQRWAPGCFVRYARYHVSKEHTLAQICALQQDAVQSVYADGKVSQSLLEKTDHFADLRFNKWMLDTVERADGTVLHLHRGGEEVPFETFLSRKGRSVDDIKCIKIDADDWVLMA